MKTIVSQCINLSKHCYCTNSVERSLTFLLGFLCFAGGVYAGQSSPSIPSFNKGGLYTTNQISSSYVVHSPTYGQPNNYTVVFSDNNRISMSQNQQALNITHKSYTTDGSGWDLYGHVWAIVTKDPVTVTSVTGGFYITVEWEEDEYLYPEEAAMGLNSDTQSVFRSETTFSRDLTKKSRIRNLSTEDASNLHNQILQELRTMPSILYSLSKGADQIFGISISQLEAFITTYPNGNYVYQNKNSWHYWISIPSPADDPSKRQVGQPYNKGIRVSFHAHTYSETGHLCLWSAINGFRTFYDGSKNQTYNDAIELTPDMIGVPVVPISYQIDVYYGSGYWNQLHTKYKYYSGSQLSLKAFINPTNNIESLTTEPITGSTPLNIRATVTPPAGDDSYRFGVRVTRWQGAISAIPDIDGWSTVHQTSATISGQYVWHDPVQPHSGGPCKIVYRLYSWQVNTPEWVNYVDKEIIVQNSNPNSANITLSASQIEYGQSVTVTGNLKDADGNLKGHSLWVIAPDANGNKNSSWDCYSRPLNPDWWGDPRISEVGWSGAWNNGQPSNGGNSTVSGIFKPYRLGIWQLHTNGCDAFGAWGPGDTKDITVVKATPLPVAGTFSDRFMNAHIPIPQGYFDAAFRNPYDNQPLPTNVITYTLTKNGVTVSIDQIMDPGEYALVATYPGDEYHTEASKTLWLVVNDNPDADDDYDGTPNGIEAKLGTSANNPGVIDTTNSLEIKILTPISTED